MARRQRPNHFELGGGAGQTTITYSTSSIVGKPQLSYKDADREASFSGDEIRSSRNALFGTLVSVELANRPDQDTLLLVLVLPTVNLDDSGTAKIRTFAVLTTHRTSRGGPTRSTASCRSTRRSTSAAPPARSTSRLRAQQAVEASRGVQQDR